MFRAAFAVWNDRIAPVCDVASQFKLVEGESGRILQTTIAKIPGQSPSEKATKLSELGVQELVCGAISRQMHAAAASYGIRVTPFVAGGVTEVIEAWLSGTIAGDYFAMPGCGCRGRGRGRSTGGGGFGQGLGNAGQRQNRGRGFLGNVNELEQCVCPLCGHREPHQRGVPCIRRRCPECGTALRRGFS